MSSDIGHLSRLLFWESDVVLIYEGVVKNIFKIQPNMSFEQIVTKCLKVLRSKCYV